MSLCQDILITRVPLRMPGKPFVGGGGDLVDLDGTVPKVDQHMLRLDRRDAKIVLAIPDASHRCVGTERPKPPPAGQGRRQAASVRPRRQRRTYTQQLGPCATTPPKRLLFQNIQFLPVKSIESKPLVSDRDHFQRW